MITEKWTDTLSPVAQAHSASAHVHIMDTAFPMPQLGRTRRIWLYLPSDYFTSGRRYPVIYMHDGQNLFDERTSYSGEWGIDEWLDTMKPACIVVGIDNGGLQRMTEYNVHDHPQHGKGEGKLYLDFIVATLKPCIDKRLRTLKTKKHTFIAGSSMGGLISFYAGLYYPKVFGAIGVLSPSFWIIPDIKAELIHLAKKKYSSQKYFFYAGGKEGATMLSNMMHVSELMKKHTKATVNTTVLEQGQHNEYTWGQVFPDFYNWIISG